MAPSACGLGASPSGPCRSGRSGPTRPGHPGFACCLRSRGVEVERSLRSPSASFCIGPATLRHIDRVLGLLESGGFSIDMAHHALHVLGSRVFGFTQDPFNDTADVRPDPVTAAAIAETLAATYPSVGRLAMAASHDARAVPLFNAMHHPAPPLALLALAAAGILSPFWFVGALAWFSHIVVDLAFGSGLRTADGWRRPRWTRR